MANSHGAPLAASILVALCCSISAFSQGERNAVECFLNGIRGGNVRVVDLTHTIDKGSPYWPEESPGTPFHTSIAATYQKDGYFARNISIPEHFGTHMDAPIHFDPEGLSVNRIPVGKFIAPAVMIDVSADVKSNADYRVTAKDIENWIKIHGTIPSGAVVLVRTGWGYRWPSQEKYMNADAKGVLHFPGLSLEAARYLLEHAHPVAVGIDTASIDYGASKDFPVHHLTMSHGLYHLENVANLDKLPPSGFGVIALPLKLGGGSGSPARVLALIPEEPAAHH
jgi:kynurenine formamidase